MEEEPENSGQHLSIAYEIEPEDAMKCLICYHTSEETEVIICSCGHTFCKGCMLSYKDYLEENCKYFPMKCPEKTCHADIFIDFRHLIDKHEYRRLKAIRKSHKNMYIKGLIWCDDLKCSGHGILSSKKRNTPCNECGKALAHVKDTEKELIKEEFPVAECPNCKTLIYKTLLCMNVQCLCGTKFCLKCGDSRNTHNSVTCAVKNKKKRISWWVITMAIYVYVLFPLLPGFCVLFYHNYWDDTRVKALKKNYATVSGLILISSPILLVIFVLWLPFKGTRLCLDVLFDEKPTHGFVKVVKAILSIPTLIILSISVLFAIAFTLAFLPFYGIYLLHLVLF